MEKGPCPQCGEELLGAANRCWKCGSRVLKPPPKVEMPVVVAEIAGSNITEGAVALAEPPVVRLSADEVSLAVAKDPPRRGSPFAFDTAIVHTSAQKTWYGDGPYARDIRTGGRANNVPPPLMPQYPRHTSAFGGVIAAYLLGAMSLMVLWFSVFGTVTAALGVGCAVWGLYSKDKRLAFIALILCCLVVMIGCWMIGYSVYDWWVMQSKLNAPAAPGM
jgi:hypothetical protein